MDYLIDPLYLFLSLTTFSLLFIIQLLPKRKSSNQLPPGPTPFPIIGSLLELGDSPHRSISKIHKSHGPIISLKLGQTTTVVVASPELAKQVLQTLDSSISAHAVPHAFSALGHSHVSVIGMAPSPQWKHIRTILKTHLFSTQPLETNRCIRKKKVAEMVEHVRGRMGQTVDIGRASLCTMMNELSNFFFSVDMVDINSDKAEEFKELVWGLMETVGSPNISDFFPGLAGADLQGRKKKVAKNMAQLYKIFDDMIDQRLEKMKVSRLDDNDLLNVLVRLQVEGDTRLDRASIKAVLLDNFVAGSDTSANVVEWAMVELLRHPSIMEKAREEIMSVVEPGRQVEESDVPHLPYLQAIVKESFRLHPPAPFLLPHKAETTVELGGYTIPKDTRVMVNVFAIGRDESLWEDPQSFIPERFLGSEISYKGRHFELLPFGSGRRICPAVPLAYQMVHLMLGSFIHSFRWKLPDGMKASDVNMTERFGLTLALAIPLPAIPLPLN